MSVHLPPPFLYISRHGEVVGFSDSLTFVICFFCCSLGEDHSFQDGPVGQVPGQLIVLGSAPSGDTSSTGQH